MPHLNRLIEGFLSVHSSMFLQQIQYLLQQPYTTGCTMEPGIDVIAF